MQISIGRRTVLFPCQCHGHLREVGQMLSCALDCNLQIIFLGYLYRYLGSIAIIYYN